MQSAITLYFITGRISRLHNFIVIALYNVMYILLSPAVGFSIIQNFFNTFHAEYVCLTLYSMYCINAAKARSFSKGVSESVVEKALCLVNIGSRDFMVLRRESVF